MLEALKIRNYTLIDELEFFPEKGLNVITGETGAGKSIMLGALSLVLGKRAELNCLRDPLEKCVIELHFDISKLSLAYFFEQEDFDFEEHSIIRREILPSGKSRAFINDTPATLKQIRQLGEQLIDIHSQHENLLLKERHFQLDLLDTWSKLESIKDDYKKSYAEYLSSEKMLADARTQFIQQKQDLEYLTFQHAQIADLNLEEGEQQRLEEEQLSLGNAEEIKLELNKTISLLDQGEQPILGQLNQVRRSIEKLSTYGSSFLEMAERIDTVATEIRDITDDLIRKEQDAVFDPIKNQQVNERLDSLYSLLKKHSLNNAEELIAYRDELANRLESIENSDSLLLELEKDHKEKHQSALRIAEEIHKIRTQEAPNLSRELKHILVELGMPDVQIQVNVNKKDTIGNWGISDTWISFTANKGKSLQPITEVASGGEVARLMLAIKYIISRRKRLPSIIFDEIDTGVSGSMAHKMGKIIRELSGGLQVICITHLAQIAAFGDVNFKVFKEKEGDARTSLVKLSKQEQESEIASLLSGEALTQEAIENARNLINSSMKGK